MLVNIKGKVRKDKPCPEQAPLELTEAHE